MLADLFARHDHVLLAFSGGKESIALARLCEPYAGRFRLLWANTGFNFPHVEALIREYGERFGLDERRSDLPANWRANGLPSAVVPIENAMPAGMHQEPRLQANLACCAALRSAPLATAFMEATAPVAVIHGQRHEDRTPGLGMSGWPVPECVEIVSPLADWSGREVLEYLTTEGVELLSHYAAISDSLDCWACPAAFGEEKGPARAAYMAKAYPQMLASVLPGVRRTQTAIGIAAARLGSSIAGATSSEGEMQPVLQWPGERDCMIAAVATVLRRPYIEAAGLLGYSCDPVTGQPIGIPSQGVRLLNVGPLLLAEGIASTIVLSEAFGESGCGVDAKAMRRILQDRPAVLTIAEKLPGYGDYHALAWTGRQLFNCRGAEATEMQLDQVDVLAALVLTKNAAAA